MLGFRSDFEEQESLEKFLGCSRHKNFIGTSWIVLSQWSESWKWLQQTWKFVDLNIFRGLGCLELWLFCWTFCRVGLAIPTVEVRFEHLNVEAQVYVGGRALPSLFNFYVNVLEVSNSTRHILFPLSTLFLNSSSTIYEPISFVLLLGVLKLSPYHSQSEETITHTSEC